MTPASALALPPREVSIAVKTSVVLKFGMCFMCTPTSFESTNEVSDMHHAAQLARMRRLAFFAYALWRMRRAISAL